jgi:hypothetical protein
MIAHNYVKANSKREIPVLLLSTNAHEEYEFRTVKKIFVNE